MGLRAYWALGLDPIPNLVELVEERGIKVLSMNLTNIDGLAARVRREDRSVASVMRFERLCFRALAEGAISEARAAELLGHPVHELNRRMDEPPSVEAAQRADSS